MSNMAYCRFHNTVGDMLDCVEHLDDFIDSEDDEYIARKKFISVCVGVAKEYGKPMTLDQESVES